MRKPAQPRGICRLSDSRRSRREIAAIVTLPMNKEATRLSDPQFTGHTELIGSLCGTDDVTIMLASDESDRHAREYAHVTYRCDPDRETGPDSDDYRVDRQSGCESSSLPRIAVAGLNPHAGENGLFGDEEIREIVPAIKWAQAQGFPVQGPFPPDTLFYMAVRRKQFDAVVCMYHDQGHIPLKLLDFEGGVNITLGFRLSGHQSITVRRLTSPAAARIHPQPYPRDGICGQTCADRVKAVASHPWQPTQGILPENLLERGIIKEIKSVELLLTRVRPSFPVLREVANPLSWVCSNARAAFAQSLSRNVKSVA